VADLAAGREGAVDLADSVVAAAEAAELREAGSKEKRMAETERKLTELTGRLKEALGATLESVILYGSAARGDFHEEHSDLNVLCVAQTLAVAELKRLAPVVQWWTRKEEEPAPLFFTHNELRESADVFAIELLDMQKDHRVLFGKDAVKDIVVPMNLHRVQVEHELRTTLLKLRQHFLYSGGEERELAGVLAKSISSVTTLLRHVLVAQGEAVPETREKVFARVEEMTGTDAGVFAAAFNLRTSGTAHSAEAEITARYGAYLRGLEKVIEVLDHHAPKRQWQRVAKTNS
jgi:predicted nucleotidyltransferase